MKIPKFKPFFILPLVLLLSPLAAAQNSQPDAAMSPSAQSGRGNERQFTASVASISDVLPYSEHVKQLQEQGQRIYVALSSTADPEKAVRLQASLAEIQAAVAADPSYALSMKQLEARLFPVRRVPLTSQALASVSFPYGQLQAGDILLEEDRNYGDVWQYWNGGSFYQFMDDAYARVFTHAALYLGNTGIGGPAGVRLTLEALNPRQGVRVCPFDGRWDKPGLHVAIGHVKNLSSLARMVAAIRAVNTFGGNGQTLYHTLPPWDKHYYQAGPFKFLYCSQLPWVIYSGFTDLDSNDPAYRTWFRWNNWWDPWADSVSQAAVFPDELRASSQIDWYYDRNNPN